MAFDWNTFKAQHASAKSIAVEITSKHRRTLAAKTWYFSTDGFTTAPGDTPANQYYADRLLVGLDFAESVWGGGGATLGGRTQVTLGNIHLANDDGGLDEMDDYSFEGQTATVKVAEVGTAIADYQSFVFMAKRAVVTDQTVSFIIENGAARLETPLQENVYGGRRAAIWFGHSDSTNKRRVEIDAGQGGNWFGAGPDVKTMEAWIFLEATGNPSTTIYTIFEAAIGTFRKFTLEYSTNPGSDAHTFGAIFTRKNGGQYMVYDAPIVTGADDNWYEVDKWIHVAVRDTGDKDTAWFINGEPYTGGGSVSVDTVTTPQIDTVTVGHDISGFGGDFQGMISEVRCWSTRRSEDEINETLNVQLGGDADAYFREGLSLYLPFDDGIGTTPNESGPDGYTTTMTDTGGGTQPIWVPSLDGDEALGGKTKPLAFGNIFNATPALVGALDEVYQIHDGSIKAIGTDQVFLNGAAIDLDTAQTDLYTFMTTTPTAGEYDTLLSHGLFRLGTAPLGTVTCNVTQGKIDASGNFPFQTADEIVRDLVTTYGGLADPGDLDTDSFARFHNEPMDGVGLYVGPGENLPVVEAVDQVLTVLQGFWFFNQAGKFEIAAIAPPGTPALSITVDDQTTTFQKLDSRDAYAVIKSGFRHNYTQQSGDDVAGVVTEARRQLLQSDATYAQVRYRRVLRLNPDAQELPITDPGLVTTRGAAKVQAKRKGKIFGRRVDVYNITELGLRLSDLKLGQTVEVIHDRHSLDEGRNFVILGKHLVMAAQGTRVSLTLWAPERRVRYTADGDRRIVGTGHARITR